jgi:hypothetical protein
MYVLIKKSYTKRRHFQTKRKTLKRRENEKLKFMEMHWELYNNNKEIRQEIGRKQRQNMSSRKQQGKKYKISEEVNY